MKFLSSLFLPIALVGTVVLSVPQPGLAHFALVDFDVEAWLHVSVLSLSWIE